MFRSCWWRDVLVFHGQCGVGERLRLQLLLVVCVINMIMIMDGRRNEWRIELWRRRVGDGGGYLLYLLYLLNMCRTIVYIMTIMYILEGGDVLLEHEDLLVLLATLLAQASELAALAHARADGGAAVGDGAHDAALEGGEITGGDPGGVVGVLVGEGEKDDVTH